MCMSPPVSTAVLLAALLTYVSCKPSPNLPCKPMKDYMPPAMSQGYNISKHNGTWYEVSFRDLYPWGPLCECQQSVKYVNEAKGYIDDYFVFSCGPAPHISYISPQRENVTNAATGQKHEPGIFDMYVRHSDFKFITHFEWNTEAIGYKDDGQDQYAWVIEYQCGTRPDLPKALCLYQTVEGKCSFTGVQMFVRDRAMIAEGREEMVRYMHSLSPDTSGSEEVAWVMDDFSGGTFPPWFKNVTWNEECPLPCESGVFNATTQMWGCPVEPTRPELHPLWRICNLISEFDKLGLLCRPV